jgi:hypothetical protein
MCLLCTIRVAVTLVGVGITESHTNKGTVESNAS